MKKTGIILMVLMLASFLSLNFAEAQRYKNGEGHGIMNIGPEMAKTLELTDEQTIKLESIKRDYLKKITPVQTELFGKRAEMRLLWIEPELDENKIIAKQKKINELMNILKMHKIKYKLNYKKVLTPIQRKNLQMLHKNRPCMKGGQKPCNMR